MIMIDRTLSQRNTLGMIIKRKKKENYEHYTQELAFKFLMCSLLTFLQLPNIILKRPQLRDLTIKHW